MHLDKAQIGDALRFTSPPSADKKFQRGEHGDDDQHERENIGMERSKVELLTARWPDQHQRQQHDGDGRPG